jgi:hypothetical protein
MKHWRNNVESGKGSTQTKTVPVSVLQQKSNTEWSRIEPGHPRYEAGMRHEEEKRNKRQERETG